MIISCSIVVAPSRRCAAPLHLFYNSKKMSNLSITSAGAMPAPQRAAAHRAALTAGGRTIAVLGSGLLNLYPPEHAELAKDVSEHGAVISEIPPRMPPRSSTQRGDNALYGVVGVAIRLDREK